LRYNKEQEEYEIKALYPLYINQARKDVTNGYTALHGFDCIYFDCAKCSATPHAYYFILPAVPKEKSFSGNAGAKSEMKGKGQLVSTKWHMNEKEQLKKMLLTYGFGRWNKIRKNSQELAKKTDAELQAYSIAFIKTLLEHLNFENAELKKNLLSITDNNTSDNFYISAKTSY